MVFFVCCLSAGLLILGFTPPSKKRTVFVPVLCLAAAGAAYAIYDFALVFGAFPGRWVVFSFLLVGLIANFFYVYSVTRICEACGHLGANRKSDQANNCPRCGHSYDVSDSPAENQLQQEIEQPVLVEMPDGFTTEVNGNICTIHHVRTGMKAQNIFLGFCCTFWAFGTAIVAKNYLTGEEASVLPTAMMTIILLVLVQFFLYFMFCKKRFRLSENALEIETEVLGLRRRQKFAKDSIRGLRQLKELSQQRKNSFPSWGLELRTIEPEDSWYARCKKLISSDRTRYCRLLYQLPYEQSEWLGIKLAEWGSVPLSLCPKPVDD